MVVTELQYGVVWTGADQGGLGSFIKWVPKKRLFTNLERDVIGPEKVENSR